MFAPILIVEDDAALARVIDRNLSSRGYRVLWVETSSASVHALEAGCPLLVLLDIDLPDGSGWDVLRAMRGQGCLDTPVIVMSGLFPNRRLLKELGCTGVLEKPFPIETLIRLVGERAECPSTAAFHGGQTGGIRARDGGGEI